MSPLINSNPTNNKTKKNQKMSKPLNQLIKHKIKINKDKRQALKNFLSKKYRNNGFGIKISFSLIFILPSNKTKLNNGKLNYLLMIFNRETKKLLPPIKDPFTQIFTLLMKLNSLKYNYLMKLRKLMRYVPEWSSNTV